MAALVLGVVAGAFVGYWIGRIEGWNACVRWFRRQLGGAAPWLV